MRGVTWCVVEEVKSGDWGIGGDPLTTEAVRALAQGQDRRLTRLLEASVGVSERGVARRARPEPSHG